MLNTLIIVILIVWLLGYLGGGHYGIPNVGGLIHLLLILVIIILLRLLGLA
jgi:hypothetical protein